MFYSWFSISTVKMNAYWINYIEANKLEQMQSWPAGYWQAIRMQWTSSVTIWLAVSIAPRGTSIKNTVGSSVFFWRTRLVPIKMVWKVSVLWHLKTDLNKWYKKCMQHIEFWLPKISLILKFQLELEEIIVIKLLK